jgi:hypothetical protein
MRIALFGFVGAVLHFALTFSLLVIGYGIFTGWRQGDGVIGVIALCSTVTVGFVTVGIYTKMGYPSFRKFSAKMKAQAFAGMTVATSLFAVTLWRSVWENTHSFGPFKSYGIWETLKMQGGLNSNLAGISILSLGLMLVTAVYVVKAWRDAKREGALGRLGAVFS